MTSITGAARCPTGIKGLDDITGGGLPTRRVFLLQGRPGVGKTTLALQFLLEGVARGEKCLYISLSETRDELETVAQSHGWNFDSFSILELSAIEDALAEDKENTFFHPSELELSKTTQLLLDHVDRVKPSRVVLDSLSEFRLLAESALRYRRQMLRLKQFFAVRNSTVLLLDDQTGDASDLHIQSIAHGVITLERLTVSYGVERRQLKIEKMRGVKFREGAHDYNIERGGLDVFPRLVASEHKKTFPETAASSGVAGLDALLGGGLDRGTSALFIGPAGCGKSTVALQFAAAAATRGEKCELFIFDEGIKTLEKRAAALGIPLTQLIEKGTIRVQQVDPAELSPGEFTSIVRKGGETRGASMIVIDSLNGYLNSMPDERFLTLQLHELLTYLNQQGIVSIMTLAQHGLLGTMQSPVDVTYLADTVVLLRYFETQGQLRKAISTVKKRSGRHEEAIRELMMGPKGIEIGPPLNEYHGVLTGVPVKQSSTMAQLPNI